MSKFTNDVSAAFDAAIDMVGGTCPPDDMATERARLEDLKRETLRRLTAYEALSKNAAMRAMGAKR